MRHCNEPHVRREDHATHVELALVYPSPTDTLTTAMLGDVTQHVAALTHSRSTSSVVLRSDHGGNFCLTAEPEVSEALARCVAAIDASSVPVVAAVDGRCRSAGLRLVLACDVVIVTERAEFTATATECSEESAAVLAQRIGRLTANAMLMAGLPLSGIRAQLAGLAHRLCPAHEFEKKIEESVDGLAETVGQQRALIINGPSNSF